MSNVIFMHKVYDAANIRKPLEDRKSLLAFLSGAVISS